MKHFNIIVSILLLIIIILYFAIYKFQKKNKVENYRYQFSALNKAEQAARIVDKIQKGIELYNKIKALIPKIKIIFETITDWNKLKAKMCIWAKNQQLLSGLIAVCNKAITEQKIQPNVKSIVEKMKLVLIKLQVYQAAAMSIKNILDLIPGIPTEIKTGVTIFINIDNNLVDLFSKAGLNLGC